MGSGKGTPVPIVSGHCASAYLHREPLAAHERCALEGCTCKCHQAPPEPERPARPRVTLACVQGRHGACQDHGPGFCGCTDPAHDEPEPGPVCQETSTGAWEDHCTRPHGHPVELGHVNAAGQTWRDGPEPDDLEPAGVQLALEGPGAPMFVGWRAEDPPPDPVADGYGWPDPRLTPAEVPAEDPPPGWPNTPYAGPLTVDQRRRLAAAWTVHDLPAALVVVDQILAEHGVSS